MNGQVPRNPPKKAKRRYCGTEVRAMAMVLLQHGTVIKNSGGAVPDEVFEKMALATEGKQSFDRVKLWYYSVKYVRERENRWTSIVEKALFPEEQEKLYEIMFAKGLMLWDGVVNMSIYPKEGYESQEKVELDKENSRGSAVRNNGMAQPPPPYHSVTDQTKLLEARGMGCFDFPKKEGANCPAPSAPHEGLMETAWFHELGAEKQKTVLKERRRQ